jgi:hypothetical protein
MEKERIAALTFKNLKPYFNKFVLNLIKKFIFLFLLLLFYKDY